MSNGFSIHKEAVMMEVYLNDIMELCLGSTYVSADITMIYDAPVRSIKRMLLLLKQQRVPKEVLAAVSEIELKYRSCEHQILTQMEKSKAHALCSDLERIACMLKKHKR